MAATPCADAEKRLRNLSTPAARVVEVFSSIQGEAELIGVRQVFVRFFGCNLRCAWCDSPETLTGHPPCRLEVRPGSGEFELLDNPIQAGCLTEAVRRLYRSPHHSLSLTGGEPLLHARFLAAWLPEIRDVAGKVYLETNGLLPEHLERVLPWVDIIAMDLKPPSCTADPMDDWLERHEASVRLARNHHLILKIVLTADADPVEVTAAMALAGREAPHVTLTLQPVTPFAGSAGPPDVQQMLMWHEIASRHVAQVRIIPQVHKMMGIL